MYDTLRRRHASMVLMVGSTASFWGVLAGGWLNNLLSLENVLMLGCIVALLACLPVVWRSLFYLKGVEQNLYCAKGEHKEHGSYWRGAGRP